MTAPARASRRRSSSPPTGRSLPRTTRPTTPCCARGTLLGLHQHQRPAPAARFSEFQIGLDHVAFGCANRDELEKWSRRLDELGIEHGGIKDAPHGSGLAFRDPDGIVLEFFAPPAAA